MSEQIKFTNKKIIIVGLGLLGGSYAMGLKKAGNHIIGIDINQKSIDYALEHQYIDEGASSDFENFLQDCDLLILCIYPNSLIAWIKQYVNFINPKALITDVCGVKSALVNEIQEILTPYNIEFYASHPMRGKEVLGIENADCNIFKNANLILCPTEKNSQEAEELIISMGKSLGFTIFPKLSPLEHDKMIAYLSQLTHVIAVCLMTAHETESFVKYSGDSFRDLTRIAYIDENLWSELFIANKGLLCDEIDIFIKNLTDFRNIIMNDDVKKMKEKFKLSSRNRLSFNKEKRPK